MKVEKDVVRELNWRERIIVKIFAKTFGKVYHKTRIKITNKFLM